MLTTGASLIAEGGHRVDAGLDAVASADASTGSGVLSPPSVPWGGGSQDVGAWQRVKATVPRELEARRW